MSDPCPKCTEDCAYYTGDYRGDSADIIVNDKNQYFLDVEAGWNHLLIPISYCPACGRKLEE